MTPRGDARASGSGFSACIVGSPQRDAERQHRASHRDTSKEPPQRRLQAWINRVEVLATVPLVCANQTGFPPGDTMAAEQRILSLGLVKYRGEEIFKVVDLITDVTQIPFGFTVKQLVDGR